MPQMNEMWFDTEASKWPYDLLLDIFKRNWKMWPRSKFIPVRHSGLQADHETAMNELCHSLPQCYVKRIEWCWARTYHTAVFLLTPALEPTLLNLLRAECLLYLEPEDEYYRDHVIHQVHVALMGDYLLRGRYHDGHIVLNGSEPWPRRWRPEFAAGRLLDCVTTLIQTQASIPESPLSRYCASHSITPASINSAVVLAAWWMAALFHDLGRSWEYSQKLSHHLSGDFPGPLTIGPFVPREVLSRLTGELPVEFISSRAPTSLSPEDKLQLLCLKKGHAAIGALALLLAIRTHETEESLHPEYRLALSLAAEAILLHHDLEKYTEAVGTEINTPFEAAPLAFLLQLCDRLDHLRPQLEFHRARSRSQRSFGFRYSCNCIKLSHPRRDRTRLAFEFQARADSGTIYIDYLKRQRDELQTRFGAAGPCSCHGVTDELEFSVRHPPSGGP